MKIEKIGVIGLGQMGSPIATFILKAGYDVTGFDVVPERMAALAPLGLKPARSPRDAATGADLVILSLRNWADVTSVVEGEGGVLEGTHEGQIIADCSTVPPAESRAMAERLAKKGVHWMDVPVSGAANQAREGNMVFMAGGEKKIFDAIKPVFDKVGKKTV